MPSRSRRKAGTTERARTLRHGDNLAEGRLWNELKGRGLGGYKFVRQLPIGPYFADFACREKRLVVELDGSQHAESSHDRTRDAFMRNAGWSVLRFWSHEARSQTRTVCETILAALEGRLTEPTVASDLRFVRQIREGNPPTNNFGRLARGIDRRSPSSPPFGRHSPPHSWGRGAA